jgi:hypothetical protein
MTNNIFDKTDKGRDEIATRENRLPPRLRTLLLLVDGKRDAVELVAKVAGLGLDEKSLVELLDGGFIKISPMTEHTITAAKVTAAPSTSPTLHSPQSEVVVNADISQPVNPPSEISLVATLTDSKTSESVATTTSSEEPATNKPTAGLREGETQFQALYNFFNETIRSAIGLRGYAIQLKVERCSTITDFKALRQPYLDAVLKAKGSEMERSLRERLDTLLQLGD